MAMLENATSTCPNCAELLSERGYFCKACATQARCMKCREVLEPAAAACVECGTRLGQSGNGSTETQGSPGGSSVPANRNTLSYQEDRNSRRFEASLTDSAMHGLGDVFGELFAQRGVERKTQDRPLRSGRDVIIDEFKQLPPLPHDSTEEQHQQPPAATANTPEPEKDRLVKIFNVEGETLEVRDNRLKAKTAADYYKRLTHLFLYAQEVLLRRSSAPKAELLTILKTAKVYDGNCRAWLIKKIGFTVDNEDRMKLIAGAREQAMKTVNEIFDGNVPDEWNPDTRTVKARAPRKAKA